MKARNILLIIGGVIVLAGLLFGASVLYKKMADKVDTENVVEFQTSAQAPAESGTPADGAQGSTPAKNFVMTDADGNEMMLSDLFDKPVVLNFWASWCPPCRAEMPDFEEMYKQHGDRINFVFVNLVDGSRETKETAKAFIEEQGFTFPIYFDIYGEGSEDYEIYYIPDTFFIDRHGDVVSYAVGGIDKDQMQAGIDKLLEE